MNWHAFEFHGFCGSIISSADVDLFFVSRKKDIEVHQLNESIANLNVGIAGKRICGSLYHITYPLLSG